MNNLTNVKNGNNGNNGNENGKTLVIHTFAEEKTHVSYGRWNKKISLRTGAWFLVGYTEKKEEKLFEAEDNELHWQIEADALSVYLAVKNAIEKYPEFEKIVVKNTNYPLSRLKKSQTKAGYYLEKAKILAKKKNVEFILKRILIHNNIAASNSEKHRYIL